MKTVLILGNIVDGISIYGPFPEDLDVSYYAQEYFKDEEWVVAKLNPVNESWWIEPKGE